MEFFNLGFQGQGSSVSEEINIGNWTEKSLQIAADYPCPDEITSSYSKPRMFYVILVMLAVLVAVYFGLLLESNQQIHKLQPSPAAAKPSSPVAQPSPAAAKPSSPVAQPSPESPMVGYSREEESGVPEDSSLFVESNMSALPITLAFVALVALATVLVGLASLLHFLRKVKNPLYWQIACWFLIAVGILIRPIVAAGTDFSQATISGVLVAGFISLSVFPFLMRFLNKLKPEPGLIHVSLPFSLGFFLDVAQLITVSYWPNMAWIP